MIDTKAKIDPDNVPSPVTLHLNDEKNYATQYYSTISKQLPPLACTDYRVIDDGLLYLFSFSFILLLLFFHFSFFSIFSFFFHFSFFIFHFFFFFHFFFKYQKMPFEPFFNSYRKLQSKVLSFNAI